MEIYERIKHLRKDNLHLTQTEFGKQLGVGRGVIANIESNALAKPEQKEPLYKLICKEFHVREEWLKTGIEPMYALDAEEDEYSRAVAEIDIKDSAARQAILDYWHLSEEDKKLFWQFTKRFLIKKNQED